MNVETHKRHLTRIINSASTILDIFKEDDLELEKADLLDWKCGYIVRTKRRVDNGGVKV